MEGRRAAAVAAARRWIGTPHVHGASLRGAGADCLGLVRGVWREVTGPEPAPEAPYPEDWAAVGRDERLWRGVAATAPALRPAEAAPGDIVLFRLRRDGPAQHLGVLADDPSGRASLIHAHMRFGVIESPLGEAWRARLVAAFSFPAGEFEWRP